MKTLATAVLSLFLTASALTLVEGAWNSPRRAGRLALNVKLFGAPAALYLAYFLCSWMTLRAQDRLPWDDLVVEAHILGLLMTALALAFVLTVSWIYTGYNSRHVLDTLPKGIAAAAAGGLGLAWGALWRLPNREEIA